MKVVNEENVMERDKSDVSVLTGQRGEQSDKSWSSKVMQDLSICSSDLS